VEEAREPITDLTRGRMADKTIITVGDIHGADVAAAMSLTGKGGRVVVTGMGSALDVDVTLSLFELTLLQKDLQGAIFGGLSPRVAIPSLLSLYEQGSLKLDELVTSRYSLEEVNQGYQDMRDGRNVRGLVVYTDADR
jgi:S-(hydroxymethyl)glutathione dehydrogenase/alcohol dehydrogenase